MFVDVSAERSANHVGRSDVGPALWQAKVATVVYPRAREAPS
jgi:hypothetical protein